MLALGLIETVGLAAAIEAADAAVKSANVKLIGYELTKGDGMATVKIEGDVGAVKAGIDAAKAAVSKMGTIYSSHVIARPAFGLENIVFSKDTVGLTTEKNVSEEVVTATVAVAPVEPIVEEVAVEEPVIEESVEESVIEEADAEDSFADEEDDSIISETDETNTTDAPDANNRKKKRGKPINHKSQGH